MMSDEVAKRVLTLLASSPGVELLDLTGGAPELNPNSRWLIREARRLGRRVIDRCNLTVLLEPGMEDLPEFLAEHLVEVVASLPCYGPENVDRQRGHGAFDKSIAALRRLRDRAAARPRLQPGRRLPAAAAGGARDTLPRRAARPVRPRVPPSPHPHQHADQPVRRGPRARGPARGVHEPPREPLQSRDGGGAHVSLAGERRLRRSALRLRLQPDARPAARCRTS